MPDLSEFSDEQFDLIFHPIADVLVPAVISVWRECYRVLRPGGALLAGFMNPRNFVSGKVLTHHLRWGRTEADKQWSYQQLFHTAIPGSDLAEIRKFTHKGRALGGERFGEQIEAVEQGRATLKGVGGPRKEKIGSDPNTATVDEKVKKIIM